MKHFPSPVALDDLYVTYLWAFDRDGKPEGIFSHATALYLQELITYVPPALDVTVPKHFRRHSTPPHRLTLHRASVNPTDCQQLRGIPITNALKSILDLLVSKSIDRDYIVDALRTAIERLQITHGQMLRYSFSAKER
ncbi:MAG: hypothetical protein ACRD3W_20110, partial [Terriglobales bacterium]